MKLRIKDLVFSADFGGICLVYDLVNDRIVELSGEAATIWKGLACMSDDAASEQDDEIIRHFIALGLAYNAV